MWKWYDGLALVLAVIGFIAPVLTHGGFGAETAGEMFCNPVVWIAGGYLIYRWAKIRKREIK